MKLHTLPLTKGQKPCPGHVRGRGARGFWETTLKTTVLVLLLGGAAVAGEYVEIKPDPVLPGNQWLIQKDGQTEYIWKKDPIVKDQIRVYNKKGKLKKTIRVDPLFPDRYRMEE